MTDASKKNIVMDWSNAITVPYTKYNIKETDFRVKTATLTTPQQLDLTTGKFCILISSLYHENFAGEILESEYDEENQLYTYQCQDWSRKWISKGEIICKNRMLQRVLKYLITYGAIPMSRAPTSKEKETYGKYFKGLRAVDKYDQSLYPGNVYKGNPMRNNVSFIARDKSLIELIRDLVYSQLGYFDVWINDVGVLQIEPLSKTDWENTGLHLTDNGFYNRKWKFSTTNAITGVVVNGNEAKLGTGFSSEQLTDIELSAFFGKNTTSINDPTQNNNVSGAVKKSNSKTSTKKTTTKAMKNPYNNRNKKIIVSADGGSDGFRKKIIDLLHKDGWSVKNLGTGPGTHSTSYNILDKSYAVNLTIYNGADPETIKEPVTGWLKGKHEKYGVQLVQMWDTSSWTNPKGMKPYRYGDFTGYTCNKAWDDNYSGKSNEQARIKDLGGWFKKYYPKVIHVCGPTASQAFSQFKAGGYFKQKGIIK